MNTASDGEGIHEVEYSTERCGQAREYDQGFARPLESIKIAPSSKVSIGTHESDTCENRAGRMTQNTEQRAIKRWRGICL